MEIHSPKMVSIDCWGYMDALEEAKVYKKLVRETGLPILVKTLGRKVILTVEDYVP